MSDYKIWIARDQDQEDEDYNLVKRGKLHMFYDSPELLYNPDTRNRYWGNARIICEIPSYMYPNIDTCQCIVYENYKLYK